MLGSERAADYERVSRLVTDFRNVDRGIVLGLLGSILKLFN